MTVTYEEYITDKDNFFKKHKGAFNVKITKPDEYGRYNKTYSFEDGSQWYESMSPEYVTAKVEVKKVNVDVEIKMFRTEYSSTESASKYYYKKF